MLGITFKLTLRARTAAPYLNMGMSLLSAGRRLERRRPALYSAPGPSRLARVGGLSSRGSTRQPLAKAWRGQVPENGCPPSLLILVLSRQGDERKMFIQNAYRRLHCSHILHPHN